MDILNSLFTAPNLPLLFVLSFLAATILPIGSEWLLIIMILQEFPIQDVIMTATVGNSLGACTTYLIGTWGACFVIRTILRIDDVQLARVEILYNKYGIWSLLLSWLPIIGDPLCLIAGIFRINFVHFSVLVFVGKFFRYAILVFVVHQGTGG
jgi:membrane protein YqaA with SNARE-associated domain